MAETLRLKTSSESIINHTNQIKMRKWKEIINPRRSSNFNKETDDVFRFKTTTDQEGNIDKVYLSLVLSKNSMKSLSLTSEEKVIISVDQNDPCVLLIKKSSSHNGRKLSKDNKLFMSCDFYKPDEKQLVYRVCKTQLCSEGLVVYLK